MSDGIPINIIPLPTLESDGSVPERSRAAMREAVAQVIKDLFIEQVPSSERSPLFGTAKDLLPQSGWSPLEMIEAAEPGLPQDALFEELGLQLTSEGVSDG